MKRLRLRRAGRCAVCGAGLAAGDEAIWDGTARTVTCPECLSHRGAAVDGQAGASALREFERRRLRREARARERLGRLGVALVRLTGEPQTTRAFRQGGSGEVRVGERLEELLREHGVRLLHDRRIPGRGGQIDHIAVGPGGVTVIDTKTVRGRVRVEHAGGVFSARRALLTIGGRDQTRLVDGVERQVELVREALARLGDLDVDVRGALCFPYVDGLPILGRLSVRDVVVDGPRPIAKVARRPGALAGEAIERIWTGLHGSFPRA
jgi:hypothetical protein